MKEIKFRAWDKCLKVMFPVADINFISFAVYSANPNIKHIGNIGEHCTTLMQFTGLKDKNGKEIYEGDIIKGIHSEQNDTNAYTIKDVLRMNYGGFELFSHPLQNFTWVDNQKIRDIHWVSHGHLNIPDIYYKIFDIEIIDNIYENPELLKGL